MTLTLALSLREREFFAHKYDLGDRTAPNCIDLCSEKFLLPEGEG
jgi:hypothetical protein